MLHRERHLNLCKVKSPLVWYLQYVRINVAGLRRVSEMASEAAAKMDECPTILREKAFRTETAKDCETRSVKGTSRPRAVANLLSLNTTGYEKSLKGDGSTDTALKPTDE